MSLPGIIEPIVELEIVPCGIQWPFTFHDRITFFWAQSVLLPFGIFGGGGEGGENILPVLPKTEKEKRSKIHFAI